jgi:hypothetical protein
MDDPRRWIPYCGEAPGPQDWLSRWNLDPVLGVGLVLLALALWRPSGGPAAPSSQRGALRCAWGLTVLLYVSPLCALSSTFFTVRVIAVRRSGAVAAMGAILATTVLMGLLGALITFAGRPLYAPHFASTLSWGVAPLDDQQLAGITMWAPGSIAYLAAAICIGWRWMRAERARQLRIEPA